MEIINNLEFIFTPSFNPTEIRVLGVKIGDNKDKINSDLIQDEIILAKKSWIHTSKNISYRIDNSSSKVIEILINKELFKEFNDLSEEGLEKRLGSAKFKEFQTDSKYLFYPQRKIVVAIDTDENKLSRFYIGENVIKPTIFTIADFLDKFFQLNSMVEISEDISEDSLKSNLPRFYRFKELMSLMQAFEIGSNLYLDIIKGNFLKNRTSEELKPVFEDIEKYAMASDFEKEQFKKEQISLWDFEWIYSHFIQFSILLRKTLNFNSGWLEAGKVSSRYIINKTGNALSTFDQSKLKEIEILLGKLLDPKQNTISKDELIRKYDYPNIDLHEIDSEWW